MGYPMTISSPAEGDVLRERERQHYAEAFTADHDDAHTRGELAAAAACYAHPHPLKQYSSGVPVEWPRSWDESWWKPKDRRRDLVRAAALIIAEIERLDRAEARKK